jgi:hypothetical protein
MIYTVFHFHNICSSCDCEFWDRWSPACDYRLAQWLEQHRDSVNIWWTNETKTGQWLSASVARKPVCWALLSRPHTASLHQFYSTLILKYSVCEANMPYPGFFFFFFFVRLGFELLNSGLFTCKAGTLLHEPHLQSILLWLFCRWSWGAQYLPGLALNCDPPHLSLPSS